MGLPPGSIHQFFGGGATRSFQQIEDLLVLLPSRTPSAFAYVAFLGALTRFLAEVVFLLDLPLDDATRGFRGAT